MFVEITKEAFNAIVENEQDSFAGNNKNELAEITDFYAKGVILRTIYNFVSNTKQYYIQDINA